MPCPKCGKNLPKYDGQSYCKSCCYIQSATWAKQNKARKCDINRAWRKRNADRRKIMLDCTNRMWTAIRNGTIKRGIECQKCGYIFDIEAAHSNYSNPLDVIWLCRKCHRSWDAANPKTKV